MRRNDYQPLPQHQDIILPLHDMSDQPVPARNLKRTSVDHAETFQNRKRRRRARRSEIPPNVHGNDWREMTEIALFGPTTSRKRTISQSQGSLIKSDDRTASKSSIDVTNRPTSRMSSSRSVQDSENQITSRFKCRECALIVPSNRNPDKCGCGRFVDEHENAIHIDDCHPQMNHLENYNWSIKDHCQMVPTNAYGTIEFEGGPHPIKAQYLRLSFDTNPADIVSHIQKVWKIEPPRLVVTIHGGMANYPLQPKLARAFRKGLVKAAGIEGAWVFTSGIDSCTVNHVTEALYGSSFKYRSKPITIGIAPWGLLKKRNELIGTDKVVSYYRGARRTDDGLVELNKRHSFFLFVDNGTVGRYGADIFLRRRLESYIAEKQTLDIGSRRVPVVCVTLEGGRSTIRSVLDYVTKSPKVPVVICDGSGRASDLMAFAHKRFKQEGELRDSIREQLLGLVKDVFGYDAKRARTLISELVKIAGEKNLLTVFRLGEGSDLDNAILTALLKGQNLTATEQLTLALAWDRADVARSDIFVMGQDWPKKALYTAMMDALVHDRVDFVRLLLENGVSMKEFLTIARLENLYNSSAGPKNTLSYVVDDVVKTSYDRYELPFIGLAIEKLIGSGFRSFYTSALFKKRYEVYRKNVLDNQPKFNMDTSNFLLSAISTAQLPLDQGASMVPPLSGNRALSNHLMWRSANRNGFINRIDLGTVQDSVVIDVDDETAESITQRSTDYDFDYPFSDLLIWAVLTRRHAMSLCMWEHGEESMAKSLVACRLYKSLAKEASEDYLDLDLCEELRNNAEAFRELSVQLLDHCYQNDEMRTLELLTYEMSNWSGATNLTLAIIVNNKQFIAHPCCQALLADLWHGGMRIRTNTNLKVIVGLIFPPSLLLIDFKSAEELKRQPQTAAEHADDSDSDDSKSVGSGSRSSSSTSSSSSSSSDDDSLDGHQNMTVRRRISTSSGHSVPHGFFSSRRRRRLKSTNTAIPEHRSVDDDTKMTMSNQSPRLNELHPPTLKATSLSVPQLHTLEKSPRRYTARLQVNDSAKTSDLPSGELDLPINNGAKSMKRNKTTDLKKFAFTNKWGMKKDKQIRFQRRIYEFFVAPITTFWSWTISFILFLFINTYVLLIKTPSSPTIFEYYLLAYVVAFGMEIIRKLFMADPKKFREKLAIFFFNYWNALTFVAVVMFIIGFVLRVIPTTRNVGRVVLATNSMLWSIKLLDFLSVDSRFGPYVTMAGKMVMSMANIVVMLMISMLAFGLTRQSITYPNEDWSWLLVRNVFYKPYFMLYGEVYADEIDTCGDDQWDEHLEKKVPVDSLIPSTSSCVPGYWIPPLLMSVFLLIGNILLISMLIAIFNNVFDTANKISHQIWLFQRYMQVMDYQKMSILPPPFTPIYHLHLVYKYIKFRYRMRRDQLHHVSPPSPGADPKKWQKAERKRKQKVRLLREQLFDSTLKLFLDPSQIEKVHDFEEECMESLARDKEYKESRTNDERLYRTCERSEQTLQKVNDIMTKDDAIKESMQTLDNRVEMIEERQTEIMELLRNLNNTITSVLDKVAVDARIQECLTRAARDASQTPQISKREESVDSRKIKEPSFDTSSELGQALTKQRSRSHLTSEEPIGLGPRSRTTTVAEASSNRGMMHRQNSVAYGSLISINRPNKAANIRPKPSFRSSIKRPPAYEYTSITDNIAIDTTEEAQFPTIPDEPNSQSPTIEAHQNEEEEDGFSDAPSQSASIHSMPEGSHAALSVGSERFDMQSSMESEDEGLRLTRVPTPTTTLKRAKDSFIRHQNVILKSYEEEIGSNMDDKMYNYFDSPSGSRHHSDPSSPRETNEDNR